MKATEQFFLMVLFIMLYKVALTFESSSKVWPFNWKATEQYFPVELFIILSANRVVTRSRGPLLKSQNVTMPN